jgi:hypothetical protein
MTTEEHSDRSIDTNQTEELLTETINKLEAIVAKLKATSTTNNLSSASVQTIVNTTETLLKALENQISSSATEEKLEPTNQTVSSITKSKLSSSKPQSPNLWQKLLNQLRSNLILTGSLVGIIVLIVAASIFFLPQKFSKTEIAFKPVISPEELPIIIETQNTTSTNTTASEPPNLPQTEIQLKSIKPEQEVSSPVIKTKPNKEVNPEIDILSEEVKVTAKPSENQIESQISELENSEIEPEKTGVSPEIAVSTAQEIIPESENIAEISPTQISEIEPEKTGVSPEIAVSTAQEIISESENIAEISPTQTSEIELEKTGVSPEKKSPEITTSPAQEIVSETSESEIIESKPEIISQPVPLKLTPEQNLIAAIQSRLEEIINQYPDDLVLSIEANFLQSNLLVKISDRWYQLKPTEQTELANEMLQKSQKLDFNQLKIKDSTGNLVARNPVVGKEIVILKRAKEKVEFK